MSIFKWTKFLWLLTVLFFVIDRISKFWALTLSPETGTYLHLSSIVSWMPNVYFRLIFNRGMSWGLLNSQANYMFFLVSLLICFITLWLLRYIIFKYRSGQAIFPESLVFLGSLSNIIDRFVYRGVIDFIVVDFGFWTFPVFNLADCAIVLGIFLMFMNMLFESETIQENA